MEERHDVQYVCGVCGGVEWEIGAVASRRDVTLKCVRCCTFYRMRGVLPPVMAWREMVEGMICQRGMRPEESAENLEAASGAARDEAAGQLLDAGKDAARPWVVGPAAGMVDPEPTGSKAAEGGTGAAPGDPYLEGIRKAAPDPADPAVRAGMTGQPETYGLTEPAVEDGNRCPDPSGASGRPAVTPVGDGRVRPEHLEGGPHGHGRGDTKPAEGEKYPSLTEPAPTGSGAPAEPGAPSGKPGAGAEAISKLAQGQKAESDKKGGPSS